MAYRRACRAANKEIINAICNFYKKQIAEAAENLRRRWSAIRSVLHLAESKTFQSPKECQNLTDTCSSFFIDKIRKTKELIKARSEAHKTEPLQYDRPFVGLPFDDLQPPSINEVRKLITSMPGKSSPVDHVPTSVIKSRVDVFAALIAHLAKLSFSELMEGSNAVQDRVHHTTAKEKGDRPRGSKQLPTYLEPAHCIEDAGKTVHVTYTTELYQNGPSPKLPRPKRLQKF